MHATVFTQTGPEFGWGVHFNLADATFVVVQNSEDFSMNTFVVLKQSKVQQHITATLCLMVAL